MGLTDTIIMGHMPESTYIAAIALGGIVFNFMYAGLNFLRMGTTGIVSQKLGSKDFDEVLLSLLRPLFIALLIGIILFLSKEFLFNLSVYFLTPEEKLQILYKEYLFVRMIGLPAGLLNLVFLGWFFGMQKTRAVMLQLIIINVVNIVPCINMFYDVSCTCMFQSMYVHCTFFQRNLFNFITKILGHILTFFLFFF